MGRRSTSDGHRELWLRIGVTLGALVIYRLGAYLPLPGVDLQLLQEIFGRNAGGMRGAVDMFSGGAFGRMSIFALNVMPYITASIWLLLLTAVSRTLRKRYANGSGLDRYARIGAVVLAALNAYGIAIGLEAGGTSSRSLVSDPGVLFELSTVATLTGGTVFVMWLADEITRRGIGNGVALILVSGIVGRLPGALADLLDLGRLGVLSTPSLLLTIVLAVGTVALIVFMEGARRRILVQYRPRLVGSTMFEGEGAYLGLKLNNFGIIPVIFASSLLLVPATLAGYGTDQNGWLDEIGRLLRHGAPAYLAYYAGLIALLAFLYTALILSPRTMADRLQSYGGVVPGLEPGKATANYLDHVLTRLTLVGAVYVAAICLLPEVLVSQYSLPFYFGGSSLLIVVCVAMDMVAQIEAHRQAASGSG